MLGFNDISTIVGYQMPNYFYTFLPNLIISKEIF